MKCSNIYCPNYHKEVCVDLAKHEAGDCPQHWETREDLEMTQAQIDAEIGADEFRREKQV